MATNHQDLKSLSEIFNGDVQFFVPDYQRGYSWEVTKQIPELWEDLENMTGNRDHYTGMFTFNMDKSNKKAFFVVDGQQRMTTLIILINELLKKINGPIDEYTTKEDCIRKYLYVSPVNAISTNLKYKFQYTTDNPSDAFFKSQILGQKSTVSYLQPLDTLYTKNLIDAKVFFADKIKDFSEDELLALFKKVTERLKFNEYLIDDVDEVYVTFETMNNRGKSLSTLELLKNRLIYLSTLFPNSYNRSSGLKCNDNNYVLRENINNAWKTIYEYLGKSSSKRFSDDAFLRDHWIMYFKYDRKTSMVFKEDLLVKTFTAKRVIAQELTIDEINDYVLSLQESIVNWYFINCPECSNYSEDEIMWLTRLNRAGIGVFKPLLMSVFNKVGEDRTISVPILEACENFRFLVSCITERRSNTADYQFYKMANEFFTHSLKSVDELVGRIKGLTISWFNIDNFINNTVDRYRRRNGFYSWSGLRYFLYEYERHLQTCTKDKIQKVSWDTFESNQSGKDSIEHIYPQNPKDCYWTDRFHSNADKNLINSLGNLLLLSVAKNAEQQNYSFEKKKKTLRNTEGHVEHNGYDEGSYSEIEVSRYEEWTPTSIVKRGKQLLDFMKDHWSIKYDFTEEDIKKLLNITNDTIGQIFNVVVDDDSLDIDEQFTNYVGLE